MVERNQMTTHMPMYILTFKGYKRTGLKKKIFATSQGQHVIFEVLIAELSLL